MNDLPRQTLRDLVAQYGPAIGADARRCRGLLMDFCGDHKREIFVLVSAVEERVVADLQSTTPGAPLELLLPRLTRRLVDNRALAEDAARWAVESWALALGMELPPPGALPHLPPPPPASPEATERLDDAQLAVLVKQYAGLDPLPPLPLAHSAITDRGLAHLAGLTNLTALDLSWCAQITDAGLKHLRPLKKLTSLDLSRTPIGDAGLAHLRPLFNLTSLDLSKTRVTDAGLIHVSALPNLTRLQLYQCNITDAGLAHLRLLNRLTHLSLEECERITDQGLRNLRALPNLAGLNLTGCKGITRRGVVALQRPGLFVAW